MTQFTADGTLAPVFACELPGVSLLGKYREVPGYADCYCVEVPLAVSQADFVAAFYTTPLFKVERAILAWLARRPSKDSEALALAEGRVEGFSAWRVEARAEDQLLMADETGRTRSWLMVLPIGSAAGGLRTRLYFGSAVVPRVDARTGTSSMGFLFHALSGFHRLYSRLLLGAARRRLLATHR